MIELDTALNYLKDDNKLSIDQVEKSMNWIRANPATLDLSLINESKISNYGKASLHLSFEDRAKLSDHPLTKQLLTIMSNKRTNLCVAVDLTKCEDILQIAESIGPHICILKTHIDIIVDFDKSFVTKLKTIASKHNFLIFEDRYSFIV